MSIPPTFDAAKPLSKKKSPSMSLEQALFEEEQEVLKLIGAKQDNLLPPAPPPIGSNRNGNTSKSSMLGPQSSLSSKSTRSGSSTVPRTQFDSLLSPQGYQFPVAANALSRAADLSGSRRKSAPDDRHRRSSSPAPRPIGLKPATTSPPPVQSFDKAYRRLSNAAMAQSGGSLGRLATRSPRSSMSEPSERLEKDKDPDSVIESSSDSDSESETSRPSSRLSSPRMQPQHSASDDLLRYETQSEHEPLSLSAAAEQERRAVASLIPTITGPGPRPLSSLHPKKPLRLGRDPTKPKRIFPASNFDSSRPGSTDGGSGTEGIAPNKEEEARKAARNAIHESPIQHTPDRTVITLIRGEFLQMEKAGEFKRQRTYLVSSDLSPQATYAMEWAIGTVLREGDTCWIVQALGKDDEPHEEKDRDTNARGLVEEVKRLLKRTRLQVKIVVEVVAAKVPKHMITEMIDYINPTLVILGCRGRSALKNIVLGSFSTYLIAKSSCPVMVARRKLKKSRKKGVSAHSLSNVHGGLTGVSSIQAARMANNLNLLVNAKVDEKDLQRR